MDIIKKDFNTFKNGISKILNEDFIGHVHHTSEYRIISNLEDYLLVNQNRLHIKDEDFKAYVKLQRKRNLGSMILLFGSYFFICISVVLIFMKFAIENTNMSDELFLICLLIIFPLFVFYPSLKFSEFLTKKIFLKGNTKTFEDFAEKVRKSSNEMKKNRSFVNENTRRHSTRF